MRFSDSGDVGAVEPGGNALPGDLDRASTLLVKESRFALAGLNAEMDFVWKRGKELGPEDLVRKGPARSRIFGKPR